LEIILGLILVTLSGFGTGSFAWPFKVIKDIHFEQYLFISMLLAIGIYPWIMVLINVPDPLEAIRVIGFKSLLISNLLTTAWGAANVIFFICIVRIGAALAMAILSSLAMSIGILLPMILKGSGLFANSPSLLSKPGMVIMAGLLVIIIGIVLITIAGFGREKMLKNASGQTEKEQASGNFLQYLLLTILAGILSTGLGLAFIYGQGPIIEAVKQQGVGEITANFAVWAFACVGGMLVNVGYAAFIMTKKKTWKLLFSRKAEVICGAMSGLQFILSVIFMGSGMVFLGVLGASIGYGITQSMQIVGGQTIGFVGGEWKGVKGKPRKMMYLGLFVILVAIIILAYSNVLIQD
jgi:L-rhamnose-H+ transport protein